MTLEDSLTGLANRRQFDRSLVHEFKRAMRSNLCLGLVLIDIDHLQTYNEQYGMVAGDVCLRCVAQAINSIPRRLGDLVARYGGGEIAVLLPLADGAGAVRVASMIMEAVQALQIVHEGSETGFVTVSCGAASFANLADLNKPLDLTLQADQALYKAKTDGRNRVVKFEPGISGDLRDPYGPALGPELERFIKSRA
jgi:diguanylate cyclase (GGDEF)-like protein